MSRRINVMVSDRLNEKLDNYSERYGVSKSSIVGFVVGQWIDQVESFNSKVYGNNTAEGLLDKMFKQIEEKSKRWFIMKRNKYKVWLANMWDENLLQEIVAIFFDLEKAKEFVECQATRGQTYVIKHNGKKIDID